MFNLNVRGNIRDVERRLKRYPKLFKDATRSTLNNVAERAQKAVQRQAKTKLDRPTPFTINGIRFHRVKKGEATARAFVYVAGAPGAPRTNAPSRYHYLRFPIEGGTRRGKGRPIITPVQGNLNRFGNIPRTRLAKAKAAAGQWTRTRRGSAEGRTFSGTPHKGAHPGIWERRGRGAGASLRLLYAFHPSVQYRGGQLRFSTIVQGVVRHTIRKEFAKALRFRMQKGKR